MMDTTPPDNFKLEIEKTKHTKQNHKSNLSA